MLMRRPEPDQPDWLDVGATLVYLNAIHRHSRTTSRQMGDLAHVLNQLLPSLIEEAAAQRGAINQQAETLDRIAATLERIEQAMPRQPEPPHRSRPYARPLAERTQRRHQTATPDSGPTDV